jgi:hypothetical protein
MTEPFSSQAITDRTLDPTERAQAIEKLVKTANDPGLLASLSTQIETELASDDHRFVIYLLGAVRRIFDRRAITPLINLLKKQVDLSFRSQCLIGLRELYWYSATQKVIKQGAETRQRLPRAGQIDENFIIHGEDLTDDDRKRIEAALLAFAEDEDEVPVLRDEARAAYDTCKQLGALIQSNNV